MRLKYTHTKNVVIMHTSMKFLRCVDFLIRWSVDAENFVYLLGQIVPIENEYNLFDGDTITDIFRIVITANINFFYAERKNVDQFFIDTFTLLLNKYQFLSLDLADEVGNIFLIDSSFRRLPLLENFCRDVNFYRINKCVHDQYGII